MELGPMHVKRLQRVKESSVSGLGVSVAVEQERAGLLPPGLHMLVSMIRNDRSENLRFSDLSILQ
jgi:hypothetical protein